MSFLCFFFSFIIEYLPEIRTNDYCYCRLMHYCYYIWFSEVLPCYLVVLTLKSHVSQQEGCLVTKRTVNEPLP